MEPKDPEPTTNGDLYKLYRQLESRLDSIDNKLSQIIEMQGKLSLQVNGVRDDVRAEAQGVSAIMDYIG